MDAQRVIKFYASLMEEVKVRLALVDSVMTGTLGNVPPYAPAEIAYLEMRLICESIALGSLFIHQEIEATSAGKLVKSYSAEFILKRLEGLHSKFYPVPFNDVGGKLVAKNVDYLTQDKLIALYHECDRYLHRGTMKTLTKQKVIQFDNIQRARDQIMALLNQHKTLAVDEQWMFITQMHAKAADAPPHEVERVRVAYLEIVKAQP